MFLPAGYVTSKVYSGFQRKDSKVSEGAARAGARISLCHKSDWRR